MPTLYLLDKPDILQNEKYLAFKYIDKIIKPDEYLVSLLIQIVDEMRLFDLNDGKIKDLKWDRKLGYHYSMFAKDRFKQNRNRIIIKKLFGEKYTYEIRIDEEYIKHRILFFCSSETLLSNKSEFFVLSFGFGKEDNKMKGLTDILSKSNSDIKKDIDANHSQEEVLNYWLGEERNVI